MITLLREKYIFATLKEVRNMAREGMRGQKGGEKGQKRGEKKQQKKGKGEGMMEEKRGMFDY